MTGTVLFILIGWLLDTSYLRYRRHLDRAEMRRLTEELSRLAGTTAGLSRAIDTANKEQ